ncbi:MAG: flagellar export protein FliJ [Lachnospiraceae bacterium]|nr:flagellar export protein FliJ [Lachnospiraceae bacterium]
MSKFIYRMQNILNIKAKLEEQAKMDYGLARARLTEEEEKLEYLAKRKSAYEDVARNSLVNSLSVRRMRENKEAILRMDEFMKRQREEIRKAEKKVEIERQKLQAAVQERKIQEKLRENAFEAFMEEEKAQESREIDELTSYTYGQKRLEGE